MLRLRSEWPAYVLIIASPLLLTMLNAAQAQTLPLSDRDVGNPAHWYLGSGEPGLYPGGGNTPSAAHLAYGLARLALVRPRASTTLPNSAPAIGLVAVGMSNANQEWGRFAWRAASQARYDPQVVVVDAAQGGIDATEMDDASEPYWNFFDQRVAAAGLGLDQVQIVWLKQSIQGGGGPFPTGAAILQQSLAGIVNVLRSRCPNLQMVLLSSRIWGFGEPSNFETAFAVKGLIGDQVNNIAAGTETRPWLLWGPYLWADGLTPRADGLFWDPALHLEADGTHPSAGGEQQVADVLDTYFSSQTYTSSWFLPAPGTQVWSLPATDDAHVDAAQPNVNFGHDPALSLATGTRVHLRFGLSGITTANVARATLVFRVEEVPNGAGFGSLFVASSADWSEDTLTQSNAPAAATLVRMFPSTSRGGVHHLDVTAAVNAAIASADSAIAFVLVPPAMVAFPGAILARETAEPPLLLLAGPTIFGDGFE